MVYNNVKIAAGWDQTLDSNDNIETFTATGGSPQKFKAGKGGMVYFAVSEREYTEGQPRLDLSGAESFSGFETVIYIQQGCHPDAYAWLKSTYRGQVTCSVCLDGTTYAEYNALLRFEATRKDDGWLRVRYIFTLIETLP